MNPAGAGSTALLRFDELSVRFGPAGCNQNEAVRNVSFAVSPGETAAIVGESGSGKSVTMLAALGLLPPTATTEGRILFQGRDLLGVDRDALDRIRGKAMSIVFQEPQSSLDPLYTVGSQIAAVLRYGRGFTRRAAAARAIELLGETGIDDPARRARSYPHELSGGQRQRVAIAMAMACEPRLLIADEPTTALDVTVAARILDLLANLKSRHGMALILISHDLGLVRRVADTIHVMQEGRVVESGPAAVVASKPRHPYTARLLAADDLRPVPPRRHDAPAKPLLKAEHLRVCYKLRGGLALSSRWFTAVEDVSLTIGPGETLGVIGESGSGKSTLGRALLRLEPSQGDLRFQDRDLQALSERALRPLRRDMQIVFQDPFASLSPRLTVGAIITEGLLVHEPEVSALERDRRAAEALEEVGLAAAYASRLPHELSGGQRQRVAIARAIILSPKLVVLDEPTSALDRSVQADVLMLLRRLQAERGLSYLFITHDLAVVRAMADRLLVMKSGRTIESGSTRAVMMHPREAYTEQLVRAAALPALSNRAEV